MDKIQKKKLILITGGARSGKSAFAVKKAQGIGKNVVYIATAEIIDPEMKTRIDRHKNSRPESWSTIEAAEDLAAALETTGEVEVVLIDCLTLLVNNLLIKEIAQSSKLPSTPLRASKAQSLVPGSHCSSGEKSQESGVRSQELWVMGHNSQGDSNGAWGKSDEIEKRIIGSIGKALRIVKKIKPTVIVVTNELSLGIVPSYPLGRFYRDLMGTINQRVATAADEVYFMISGIPMKIKG